MDDAFGELRSLVQASPNALEDWSHLLYIVMRQEGGDLEAAVSYLHGHIASLPEEERLRAVLDRDDTLMARAMAGEDHPALSLIHDVAFRRSAPLEGFEAMFSCARLAHVERYTLVTPQPAPARHWELLASAPHWSGLRTLRVDGQRFDRAVVHALLDSGTLDGLRDLSLLNSTLDDEGAALVFAPGRLPALRRLDVTGSQRHDRVLFEALTEWAPGSLEHLAIGTDGSERTSPTVLSSPWTQGLRSLAVHTPRGGDIRALLDGPALDGLVELELSLTATPAKAFWYDPRMRTVERLSIRLQNSVPPRQLTWILKDSVTARSVRHLTLSGWRPDWPALLENARMPHLRTLELDLQWDDPFPLDEVFPALERSTHTWWKNSGRKEITYDR